MGIKISNFYVSKGKTVKIGASDGNYLTVVYDPEKFTTNMVGKLGSIVSDASDQLAALSVLPELLSTIILSWDLEDENDQPYPTTPFSIGELPVQIMTNIATKIFEDTTVGE